MPRAVLFLALAVLAACARPLTDAEERFARDLFGPSLDTSKIAVAQGLGLLPPPRTVPARVTRVAATDQACLRTPQPRGAQPPQAFALWHCVHFDNGLYSSDMAFGWPSGPRVPQALVLAHELTHVWQWQNRKQTGYSPLRAIRESLRLADPYYSATGEAPEFLSFGFEQQAAMVEDFVCFSFANPDHPRRGELLALLAPVLPVEGFEASFGR